MLNYSENITFDWGYNPLVEVGFFTSSNEVENLRTVSLSALVEVLKKHEKVDDNAYAVSVKDIETGRVIKVRYLHSIYYVSDGPFEEYSFHTISNAIFKGFFTNEMSWMRSLHIKDFISIVEGGRAPRGYWSELDSREIEDINRFIIHFILGIQTREEALSICTKDLALVPNSYKTLVPNFSIYELAASVFHDIKKWEMKHLPRGTGFDDDVFVDAIDYAINHFDTSIDRLSRKQLYRVAPSVLNKLKNMNSVREFYLRQKKER